MRRYNREISTHALTWRATEGDRLTITHLGISTHALTWRATGEVVQPVPGIGDFYPRPHMEGDRQQSTRSTATSRFLPTPSHGGRHDDNASGLTCYRISTHALTWRATGADQMIIDKYRFLPTPSHGGRPGPAAAGADAQQRNTKSVRG